MRSAVAVLGSGIHVLPLRAATDTTSVQRFSGVTPEGGPPKKKLARQATGCMGVTFVSEPK